MKRKGSPRDTAKLLSVVAAVLVVAALYFARVVFIPLTLAVLLTILLAPVIALLEKIKLPRTIAILLVLVCLFSVAGVVGWKASQQLEDLSDELPTYQQTLEEKIQALKSSQPKGLGKASDVMKALEKEVVTSTVPGSSKAVDAKKPVPGSSPSRPMAVEIVPPTNPLESVENLLGPLATSGVVVIFTIFMLAGREDLRNRFIRLAGAGQLNAMTQALDEATGRINRYLFLQLLVNIVYGVIVGTSLYFIGIPNAWLWGLVAGVLRFLPYAGPPIAALAPIVLSLALFPGWNHALITLGMFVALEMIVSNLAEPMLYGAHVGLSALAILVAAVFWTLIWGFPGLVLSTPLTVCLVVLGRYVPSLGFLNIVLGDEPVLSPEAQFYQRLLAADQDEARRIVEDFLKEHSPEELYTGVLIPALSLAEQDRHRNELEEETQNFIFQSTREIVEEMKSEQSEALSLEDAPVKARVLCVPARDEADEIVAWLLSDTLENEGYTRRAFQSQAMRRCSLT
jgi:predicted PurR-regulated permease PerM